MRPWKAPAKGVAGANASQDVAGRGALGASRDVAGVGRRLDGRGGQARAGRSGAGGAVRRGRGGQAALVAAVGFARSELTSMEPVGTSSSAEKYIRWTAAIRPSTMRSRNSGSASRIRSAGEVR